MNRTIIIGDKEDVQAYSLHEAILKLVEDINYGFELNSDERGDDIFEKMIPLPSGGSVKALIKYTSEKQGDVDLLGIAAYLILEGKDEQKLSRDYEKFCCDILCAVLTLSQECYKLSLKELCEFLDQRAKNAKYSLELYKDHLVQKGAVS